jgi:hypothetical protein
MLPTIVAPQHEVKLFSVKKPVMIRPYLVAEEKIFLTAQQSNDAKEIEAAVKQIILNVTNNAINVDKLPSFDLEYLFLQMRARSVNNLIEVRFRCNNDVPSTTVNPETGLAIAKCGGYMPVKINIDDIKLTVPEGHTNQFSISDDVGVTFKYPTYETMQTFISADLTDNLQLSTLLKSTLATVFTKTGEVHEISEQPPAEVDKFVDSLTLQQVDTLKVFFETMPRVQHKFTFECPMCHYTEDVVLEGLLDFFD